MNKITEKKIMVRFPKENMLGITDCYSCDNKNCKNNGIYKIIDINCNKYIPPMAIVTIESIEYEQLELDLFND